MSNTVGVPSDTPEAEHSPASLLTATSAGAVIVGMPLSSTVTTTVVVEVLPQASTTVNTTSLSPTVAQSKLEGAIDKVTSLHPSADPLSTSAASMDTSPFASSSTTMSWPEAVGLVVSTIVKVALRESSLPQSSVAVKVTVAAPVAPHKSLSALKLLLQVTLPQASVAVAPPLLANHAFNSVALPEPSHSTVKLLGLFVMVGRVVSSITNVDVVEDWLPQASVAVNVTTASPALPQAEVKPV